jgi:hypothetical protein
MRYLMVILAATVLVSFAPGLAEAQNRALCGKRTSVVAGLEDKYSETPVSIGLATNGSIIEVFASKNGSFTIMITTPNGLTCLIAAGHNWESLKPRLSGLRT